MHATSADEATWVVAAQSGDRRSLEALLAAHLPLAYTIAGRAVDDPADVDDIVQETMLRVLHDLPMLRAPQSFRVWLVTITLRQVGTHRRRREAAVLRAADLSEACDLADSTAEFEDLTILRLGLSGQRRQVAAASRWLDADDRVLESLWWLETLGRLSRAELAGALGLSVAHTGVRVQRMVVQLELTRTIVAVLDTRPRCDDLERLLSTWSGHPGSMWRKRIARHIRGCATCGRAAEDLVPAPQLLIGLATNRARWAWPRLVRQRAGPDRVHGPPS